MKLTIHANQIECSHTAPISAPQIMDYIILSDIAPLKKIRLSFTQERVLISLN